MVRDSVRTAALVVLVAGTGYGQSRDADWIVYLQRIGPIRIGTPIDQVRRALSDPGAFLVQALRQEQALPREPDDSPCAYLVTREVPDEVGLMFSRGRLVRVDVFGPGVRTASGAAVGDTEARILALYGGQIEVAPHHYPPLGAHYLIFTPVDPSDREYRMLFETDGATVTRFRVGTADAVGQVEECA